MTTLRTLNLFLVVSLSLGAAAASIATASAQTLLIDRVKTETAVALPKRGTSMAQVEKAYGAPTQKFGPVAGPGSRKRNPPITRWVYPNFTVYFEYSHVVDAVQNKGSAEEIGPKPVK